MSTIELMSQTLSDVVNQETGNTRLMELILKSHNSQTLVDLLKPLTAKQVGLTKRNLDGFTAVHLAILKADVDVVRVLLQKAHNLVSEIDYGKLGYSLLQCAVLSQNRYLIQEVSQYSNNLHYRSEDGVNALEVSLTGSLLVINFMALKYDVGSLQKAMAYLVNENAPFYSKHNQQAKEVLENIIEQKRCTA